MNLWLVGIETQSSAKPTNALNHRAISPSAIPGCLFSLETQFCILQFGLEQQWSACFYLYLPSVKMPKLQACTYHYTWLYIKTFYFLLFLAGGAEHEGHGLKYISQASLTLNMKSEMTMNNLESLILLLQKCVFMHRFMQC